ncbi:GNAT family N-acetyltransferase [Serinicoccus kebangsaanensis]|uniref:GNAT family N-acetyltransferase n=1 Tax=Serinicoccus kebangsaanensis TaxID=2602069 RepID=UPI00124EE356|nr:GNAT family N-acetyltransferase [Serinicoccus kebangsaanensis]
MQVETHPVTPDRFEDFADVVNPNRRATHCWCVTHRLRQADVHELGGDGDDARERAMLALCERDQPPGVVAYADGTPVAWCNIGRRADMPFLARSSKIRPVDDVDVWSIVCVVVRGGHRKRGHTTPLLEGAVAYAAAHGAPAVEAYPVEPEGRMDTTMAFVGTRQMFEKVGFEVIGRTDAVASRLPRIVMRRTL